MTRKISVSESVYQRLLSMRGERTRGRCRTMSDVIESNLPDYEDEFENDEAENDYEEPEDDECDE